MLIGVIGLIGTMSVLFFYLKKRGMVKHSSSDEETAIRGSEIGTAPGLSDYEA